MMIRNLLLAVDTDTSNEPVKVAGDLAELSGASVLVLHCAEMDRFFDSETWLDDDTATAQYTAGRSCAAPRAGPTWPAPQQ